MKSYFLEDRKFSEVIKYIKDIWSGIVMVKRTPYYIESNSSIKRFNCKAEIKL